jgi:hypothetical protein
MVGPPSERELCFETMKIKVHWLASEEPRKAVPIHFAESPHKFLHPEREPRGVAVRFLVGLRTATPLFRSGRLRMCGVWNSGDVR